MNGWRGIVLLAALAGLAGCSSARFDGFGAPSIRSGSDRIDNSFARNRTEAPQPAARPSSADDILPGSAEPPTAIETLEPDPPTARSGDIRAPAIASTIVPTDPAPAGPQASGISPSASAAGGLGAPGIPAPAGSPQTPPDTRVAALPRAETPRPQEPRQVQSSTATSVAGTWTVTDAGDRCRITLTTTPLFEFYRAAPQNCRAPSLSRINAWEQRGNEVVLLQPGGRVAARLFPQAGGYSGATASGATVTMNR